ncbi:aspartic peptidase domain-containing protein [Mycena rosella]|uniref:Aspartic peptidase domain-containing protein n=1 Tax=Mycena rosella TaxID=1033263 RepID=A0AAD7G786_MYCRO|nr:aspartic peptidase domain-containing protein [Mycena rosella]
MALIPLLLLVLAAVSSADLVNIPIFRAPGQPNANDHVADAERTRTRYSFPNFDPPLGRRQDLPLVDQGVDSAYYCTVSIGTPGQSLDLVLDMTASDSWVADTSCVSGCTPSMRLFDLDTSSSAETTFFDIGSITYGSGDVSGDIFTDTMQLGSYVIPSQAFLGASRIPTNLIQGSASGVLGLGLQGTFKSGPVFLNLLNITAQAGSKQKLQSAEMAFWLNRFAGTAEAVEEEPGGRAFTLGGANATLYSGDISFVSVANASSTQTYWMIELAGITVQGSPVQITPGDSALATFTPATGLIGGPTSDVFAIWSTVPGAVRSPTQSGFFQFPCSTKLDVTVSFGGRSWPIDPVDLNLGPISTGNSQCLGAIYELSATGTLNQNSPNWIFGAAFLASAKNVYAVFRADPLSIGFAELSTVGLGVPSSPLNSGSSTRISPWPIVGAVLGFLAVVIIAVLVWRGCRRRRRTDSTKAVDAYAAATPRPPPSRQKSASSALSYVVDSPASASPQMSSLAYTNREAPTAAGNGYGTPQLARTIPPPPEAVQLATGLRAQQAGPSPNSTHPNRPGASPPGTGLNESPAIQTPSAVSPPSDGSSSPPHAPSERPSWPRGTSPSDPRSGQEIQELRRTSADESDTAPPIPRPDGPSASLAMGVHPSQPPAHSLSIVKREQTAAAHHYGAQHIASNVLVATPHGLQLSPGFNRMEPSAERGILEVSREHIDASPPMYSRYGEVV